MRELSWSRCCVFKEEKRELEESFVVFRGKQRNSSENTAFLLEVCSAFVDEFQVF